MLPLMRFLALFVALGLVSLRAQDAASTTATADDAQKLDAPATRPVARAITLSDFGAEDLGYLAIPTTPPTVGIVLVPDAYGLDDFTKHEAERLAGEGYLAVAVDIYNGRQTTDPGEIANLTANLDGPTVMKTVNAGIRLFNESPKFHVDHVVAVGWGVGAKYVLQAAHDSRLLDGAVTIYGPVETQGVKKAAVPICAIYPENDPIATHDVVLDYQHGMRDAGNDFTAWFIAAGAGWSNPQNKHYNPVEDREAWKVAEPFIVRIGAEPVRSKKPSVIDKMKDGVKGVIDKL
jgi:carboxymethylenebutenolidase